MQTKATMKVKFEVINGPEGKCLAVANNDGTGYRLAGPKPWGGGTVAYTFEVDVDELLEQVQHYQYDAQHPS